MKRFKKLDSEFETPYTCMNAIKQGGLKQNCPWFLWDSEIWSMDKGSKVFCIWLLKCFILYLWL